MRMAGWKGSGCAALVAAACSVVASAGLGAGPYATTPASAGAVNPKAIPLGDGYVSSSPKVGYVDSCRTQFGGIGGAQVVGPWIDTSAKTWDSSTKIAVAGSVKWPSASWSVKVSGATRVIRTNDLPNGHATGVFPVANTDPASSYDRNPNRISAQSIVWSVPLNPREAASPSCTSGGPIGVLSDGVVLFNALDGEGRDAAAHEVLDVCAGHPEMSGTYHHHDIPSCILDKAKGRSTLIGYSLDGYGIYVERDAAGAVLTNTALDPCHGRTSRVLWNGKLSAAYHYDATLEYPYTVGCFHGTPISTHP
jgi:hypothetical protein